jgi:hypothetical protein
MELSLNPNLQLIHVQGAYFSNQKTLFCHEILHLIIQISHDIYKSKKVLYATMSCQPEKMSSFPKKHTNPMQKNFTIKRKK